METCRKYDCFTLQLEENNFQMISMCHNVPYVVVKAASAAGNVMEFQHKHLYLYSSERKNERRWSEGMNSFVYRIYLILTNMVPVLFSISHLPDSSATKEIVSASFGCVLLVP